MNTLVYQLMEARKDVESLKLQNTALKELLKLAYQRLLLVDPNDEHTKKLYNELKSL